MASSTTKTDAPAGPAARVEEIARIIDPTAFKAWQAQYDYCLAQGDDDEEARATANQFCGLAKQMALDKARQITAPVPADQGEPSGEDVS